MHDRNRMLAGTALFVALALVLSYVESLFPLPVPVPGVKLGLANLCVLCLLGLGQPRRAALVNLVRVCLSALLFSGFSGFLYALSGALISYLVMLGALKLPAFSLVGVSVLGGTAHTLAQLALAAAVTQTASLFGFAPVLAASGAICGLMTGAAASTLVPMLEKLKLFSNSGRKKTLP